MGDINTKAYAQWVVIEIINSSKEPVVIKNLSTKWGKFYRDSKSPHSPVSSASVVDILNLDHNTCIDDKDEEVEASTIENTKILSKKRYRVNSCGRKDASSGTEGSFDLEEEGGEKVRHFYWDCPWGKKTNTWTVSGMKHPPRVHAPE